MLQAEKNACLYALSREEGDDYVFMHHGLDIAADTSALNPTSWLTGY